MKKKVFGIVLVVAGIIIGSFVGYWLIYDGIISILEWHQSGITDAGKLSLSIIKVISAGFVGTLVCSIFVLPGVKILTQKYFK